MRTDLQIPDSATALIFDCDGTLADTMPYHREAWEEAFQAAGRPFPYSFWARRAGVPTEVIVREYNLEFGDTLDPGLFSADKQRRVRTKLGHASPIEPVTGVARRYKGVLPQAVVSGGTRTNVAVILAAIGLAGHFDVVLTADDGFTPKPAPDLFLAAARELNVAPAQCHVFEDAEAGIRAAHSAGMSVTNVGRLTAPRPPDTEPRFFVGGTP